MAVIRLTKEFSFEAAHALDGYDGPCREIHGHSYRLFVTVKGTPQADDADPKCGMVMDFGLLKRIVYEQIVSRFDHSFVIRRTEQGEQLHGLRTVAPSGVENIEYHARVGRGQFKFTHLNRFG